MLTNDGDLAHRLAHPRYGVPKVYEAEVEGAPTSAELELLRGGIALEDGVTAPVEVRVVARSRRASRLELTLHEGRKHQVKRMCAAVGHPVRWLHRARYAGLDLAGLEPGHWRELTKDEVAGLRERVGL
jgi:pseudouridine synthase